MKKVLGVVAFTAVLVLSVSLSHAQVCVDGACNYGDWQTTVNCPGPVSLTVDKVPRVNGDLLISVHGAPVNESGVLFLSSGKDDMYQFGSRVLIDLNLVSSTPSFTTDANGHATVAIPLGPTVGGTKLIAQAYMLNTNPNNGCMPGTGATVSNGLEVIVQPERVLEQPIEDVMIGNRYRWAEHMIPASQLANPTSFPLFKDNIGRMELDVTEVSSGGYVQFPVTNCKNMPVALDPTANPYEVCHVNFQTFQGITVINEPYSNYSNMKVSATQCNPSYLYGHLTQINNHSESWSSGKAVFDPISNALLGVLVESCSPDNGGSSGFDTSKVKIRVFPKEGR